LGEEKQELACGFPMGNLFEATAIFGLMVQFHHKKNPLFSFIAWTVVFSDVFLTKPP